MADQLLFTPVRVFDDNGDPGAGYLVTFYQSGTTTPKTVYSDSAATTPLAQPVTADAEGTFPAIFVSSGATKAVITDADGATVATIDPVFKVSASGSGASEVTFDPTIDLPFTNVQDAIEGAAASAATGFNAYGLGVTGAGVLLAGLDATNIGAGQYRYDGTTTGTFPTAVTKADGGTVIMSRESATAGWQILMPGTAHRMFARRMAASAWQAWTEIVQVAQGAGTGSVLYKTSTTWASLAAGAAGQVLAVNSGATAPEWVTPNTGRVLLATKTASASASLDFTEFSNGTYRLYEFEFENVLPAADNVDFYMRTSTDGGVSYDAGASDYAHGQNGTSAASATQGASAGATAILFTTAVKIGNAAAEYGVSGRITLYGAPSATVFTQMTGSWSYWNTSGGFVQIHGGGARLSAADVDACQFLFSSGNIASGTIRMYGIV